MSEFDLGTVRKLNALTSDFYAREAASFSATRQSPWKGWDEAWHIVAGQDPALAQRPLTVLDLGCGNLRFERFLAERAQAPISAIAVDNCEALANFGAAPEKTRMTREGASLGPSRQTPCGLPAEAEPLPESDAPVTLAATPNARIEFRQIDIVEGLINGTLPDRLPQRTCDLAVAFGLMHHLATHAQRTAALRCLASALRPGGFAVVSFWQFMNDPRIAAKAEATTAQGRVEAGLPPFGPHDYLLGWQHAKGVYRFCHHTDDEEIDRLLAEPGATTQAGKPSPAALGATPSAIPSAAPPAIPGATPTTPDPPSPAIPGAAPPVNPGATPATTPLREVARFSADGKQGNLNRYLVLQRL